MTLQWRHCNASFAQPPVVALGNCSLIWWLQYRSQYCIHSFQVTWGLFNYLIVPQYLKQWWLLINHTTMNRRKERNKIWHSTHFHWRISAQLILCKFSAILSRGWVWGWVNRFLVINGWGISCEIALAWISLDFTDDQSTLVQAMAWCRQATSHYLSQYWPRSLSPTGITRPQWVNMA